MGVVDHDSDNNAYVIQVPEANLNIDALAYQEQVKAMDNIAQVAMPEVVLEPSFITEIGRRDSTIYGLPAAVVAAVGFVLIAAAAALLFVSYRSRREKAQQQEAMVEVSEVPISVIKVKEEEFVLSANNVRAAAKKQKGKAKGESAVAAAFVKSQSSPEADEEVKGVPHN